MSGAVFSKHLSLFNRELWNFTLISCCFQIVFPLAWHNLGCGKSGASLRGDPLAGIAPLTLSGGRYG
jgi:hypothetical protein